MEFRFRAGEERDFSSSSSSNGYFADQALRAGFGIGSSGLVPPAMSRTEALLEELRKERIREELLTREITHKRMLEEDIRRELELERRLAMREIEEERFLPMETEARAGFGVGERLGAGFVRRYSEDREFERSPSRYRDIGTDEMIDIRRELELERRLGMRRIKEERFLSMEMEARVGLGEKSGAGFVLRCPEAREDERLPSRFRDIRMDERPAPCFRDFGDLERPPVPKKSMVGKMKLSKLLSKQEISGSKDNKSPDHQVSGVKRKAASELPRLAKKEWSCSLCHVTATSHKTLNKHLQGKKHKAKEELLTNKAMSKKAKASASMEKVGKVPLNQGKGVSANEPTKKIDTEGKKQQYKHSKAVWCDICKVECNSPAMLDCHLNGKKHKAQLKSKKDDGIGTATTPTAEVVKEVTDEKGWEEDVKAEDNAEATDRRENKRR